MIYLKENSWTGYVALVIFIFLFMIGENIVTNVFCIDYRIYLRTFYIISLVLFIVQFDKLKADRNIIIMLSFILYMLVYAFISHRKLLYFPQGLVAGMLLFICMPSRQKFWRNVTVVTFLTFILNAFIALLERVSHQLLFGWSFEGKDGVAIDLTSSHFRSVALFGHPLQNALIMTTVMTFVLCSKLKSIYKYSLWGGGFVSILCFEGRSSIILNFSVLLLYLVFKLLSKKKGNKSNTFISGIVLLISILYLYQNSYLGERLKTIGINDSYGSTEARLNAIDMLNFVDMGQLLYGVSSATEEVIRDSAGVEILENFWIAWIFVYGLVILVPFIVVVVIFAKHYYKGYSLFEALFTAVAFVLLASTNNSLQWSYVPVFVFFVCIYIFNPQNINCFIPQKYLADDVARRK